MKYLIYIIFISFLTSCASFSKLKTWNDLGKERPINNDASFQAIENFEKTKVQVFKNEKNS